MRIGIVTGEYPPLRGGVGAYTHIVAQHMLENDDVSAVHVFSNSNAQKQHSQIPVENHVTKWTWQTLAEINQWTIENHLNIVNLQFQTAAYEMSPWIHFLARRLSVPLVTTFHDLRFPYLFPKAGFLRDWIVMHLAKSSAGVIVTNHEDTTRVANLHHVQLPIGSNIPYQSDVDTRAYRARMGLNDDDFVVGHFGFLNHSKGIDTLLKAIAMLPDKRIKLLMIGGRTGTADPTNHPYAQEIDQLIASLAIYDCVIWTGYVTETEVASYLQASDVVALPYRDGASFRRGSLMAAIQQGCPIITTKPTVPIPEFTPDNMLLITPEKPNTLAAAIQSLQKSPEKCKQLSEAITALHPHFDWERIVDETLAFFESVIAEKVNA
ncbi:MAG: glycosyltransferase [Chloroflexota bacterium]